MSLNTISKWRAFTQLSDTTKYPDALVTVGLDAAYNFLLTNDVVLTGLDSKDLSRITQGENELATSLILELKNLSIAGKPPQIKAGNFSFERGLYYEEAERWRKKALFTLRPYLPKMRPYAQKLVDRHPVFISGKAVTDLKRKTQTTTDRPTGG